MERFLKIFCCVRFNVDEDDTQPYIDVKKRPQENNLSKYINKIIIFP